MIHVYLTHQMQMHCTASMSFGRQQGERDFLSRVTTLPCLPPYPYPYPYPALPGPARSCQVLRGPARPACQTLPTLTDPTTLTLTD